MTSAADYHADLVDAPAPTLSKSIAHILCTQSPAHARAAHPKLNPNLERQDEERFDIGTAAHSLLLEGMDIADVLLYTDWRTAAAKEAREVSRAHGRIPLLHDQWERVKAMVEAARVQLERVNAYPPLFKDGIAEPTLTWQEPSGVWCRARLDWLHDDLTAIDDYKSTGASAHPMAWGRTMFQIGGDLQAATYRRAVQMTKGRTPAFRFVVQETFPPYALSVIEPGPDVLAVGESKLNWALETWRVCIEKDDWPAYPTEVASPDLPAWEEARWLERIAA